MQEHGSNPARQSLADLGIDNARTIWWNLSPPALYEQAIQRGEGLLAAGGPLVVRTGQHTGRSPNDKFIVREPGSADRVWWGRVNRPFDPECFARLFDRVRSYLQGKDLYVLDCFVNADSRYRLPLRVVTELAWHNLFARNLLIPATGDDLRRHTPGFTVLDVPSFRAEPERDGTNSPTFIILDFARRIVLIGGTAYAGEIKKSVFTLLNYLLPQQGVLSMHCSANVGPEGDTAILFGLSGTGKTTLSADPSRTLIGDDEHGWSDQGIFNFEGGCYAKVIRLSPAAEPEIYAAAHRFGTVLENVTLDMATRQLDLDDDSLTENTRAAYPLDFNPNTSATGLGGHPRNVLFLTADAFGVLPPISRLTPEQAMYQFLLGYTAKVAGTERGVTEPEATFSTCFGAPFLVLPPTTYAGMLGERINRHSATVWLVNTGWAGGAYGVGRRMPIGYTRAMVRAALGGELARVPMVTDPVFGFAVPTRCPEVPDAVLQPRATWADPAAYDRQARHLAAEFERTFAQYADAVPAAVRNAGPLAARTAG